MNVLEQHYSKLTATMAAERLAVLEEVGFVLGFMSGLRTRGRKPSQMSNALQKMKPLQQVYRNKVSFYRNK